MQQPAVTVEDGSRKRAYDAMKATCEQRIAQVVSKLPPLVAAPAIPQTPVNHNYLCASLLGNNMLHTKVDFIMPYENANVPPKRQIIDDKLHAKKIRGNVEKTRRKLEKLHEKSSHSVVINPFCQEQLDNVREDIDKLQNSIAQMEHADICKDITLDIIAKLAVINGRRFHFAPPLGGSSQLLTPLNSSVCEDGLPPHRVVSTVDVTKINYNVK
jgi:hypothetical protein